MIGCGGSSAGVGRSLLGAARECEGDAKFEEVRRMAGDRGGVDPPALCNELRDGLLCIVGVFDGSLLLNELELGVLRRGLFCSWGRPDDKDSPSANCFRGEAMGEDGGRAVAAAAPSESRVGSSVGRSEGTVPWLFVDSDI